MNHTLPAVRCLQIGRHPILNWPYPALLHHWTEAEFERFLDEQRFPSTGNQSQLAWRRHCVIEALTMGEFVPQEVLDEQPELIVTAHARHLSDEAIAGLNTRITAARDAFELKVGFSVSEDIYRSNLASLLKEALTTSNAPLHKPLLWQSTQVWLNVDQGRRPQWGVFGLVDAGRPKTLKILPTSNSVWPLHSVSWKRVESVVEQILVAGVVTLEQAWALLGTGWLPESMRRGAGSASAPANAEVALT